MKKSTLKCEQLIAILVLFSFIYMYQIQSASCSPIDEFSSYTALEEATAAVAGIDAIVFTTA